MLAALMARPMVSRSRISPTSTTSTSWRGTARSAAANDSVCVPTSRWLIMHRLFLWTNSTGSSMVTMCRRWWRLMWSIMAASVVDLPLPVGPVTSTSPLRRSVSRFSTAGSFSSSSVRIRVGISRITEP